MSRKVTTGGKLGLAALAFGVGGMVWTNIIKNFDLATLSRVAVIVGVIVVCYAHLVTRTETNSQTYRIGYDLGYERGHQEGRATARPVVVDLESRRVECPKCHPKASTSGPKVVDRV